MFDFELVFESTAVRLADAIESENMTQWSRLIFKYIKESSITTALVFF